jgi:hypothetical protein
LSEDSENITYLEGSSKILTEYLINKLNKNDPKFAYFGDQYTSDVSSAN